MKHPHAHPHSQTSQTKSIIKILCSTPSSEANWYSGRSSAPCCFPNLQPGKREKRSLSPGMEDAWRWINGWENKWSLGESLYLSIQSRKVDGYFILYWSSAQFACISTPPKQPRLSPYMRRRIGWNLLTALKWGNAHLSSEIECCWQYSGVGLELKLERGVGW